MDKANKRGEWAQRLAAFECSGLSRRAWCKAQGVNVNTLDYWSRRLRAASATPSGPPALVPIMVRTGASTPSATLGLLEFEWPNGLRLRVPSSANSVALVALVRALSPC